MFCVIAATRNYLTQRWNCSTCWVSLPVKCRRWITNWGGFLQIDENYTSLRSSAESLKIHCVWLTIGRCNTNVDKKRIKVAAEKLNTTAYNWLDGCSSYECLSRAIFRRVKILRVLIRQKPSTNAGFLKNARCSTLCETICNLFATVSAFFWFHNSLFW